MEKEQKLYQNDRQDSPLYVVYFVFFKQLGLVLKILQFCSVTMKYQSENVIHPIKKKK